MQQDAAIDQVMHNFVQYKGLLWILLQNIKEPNVTSQCQRWILIDIFWLSVFIIVITEIAASLASHNGNWVFCDSCKLQQVEEVGSAVLIKYYYVNGLGPFLGCFPTQHFNCWLCWWHQRPRWCVSSSCKRKQRQKYWKKRTSHLIFTWHV